MADGRYRGSVPSLYFAVRTLVRPFIRLIWRPRVSGIENFPSAGGVIVASNHLANIDSFIIPVIAPRQVRFPSKDDFWKNPGIKGRIQKWFMTTVGTIPVDRNDPSSGQGALKVAAEVLADGEVFGIYPEGRRSRDGLLHKGRPGVAWLAMESGCPVVPLGLRGTDKVFGTGKKLPTRQRMELHFGAPVDFSGVDADAPASRRRREMTAIIMDRIQELSGQERAEG